jgi:hypothetical protein
MRLRLGIEARSRWLLGASIDSSGACPASFTLALAAALASASARSLPLRSCGGRRHGKGADRLSNPRSMNPMPGCAAGGRSVCLSGSRHASRMLPSPIVSITPAAPPASPRASAPPRRGAPTPPHPRQSARPSPPALCGGAAAQAAAHCPRPAPLPWGRRHRARPARMAPPPGPPGARHAVAAAAPAWPRPRDLRRAALPQRRAQWRRRRGPQPRRGRAPRRASPARACAAPRCAPPCRIARGSAYEAETGTWRAGAVRRCALAWRAQQQVQRADTAGAADNAPLGATACESHSRALFFRRHHACCCLGARASHGRVKQSLRESALRFWHPQCTCIDLNSTYPFNVVTIIAKGWWFGSQEGNRPCRRVSTKLLPY